MKKIIFAISIMASLTACMGDEYTISTTTNDVAQKRIVSISTNGLTATTSRASNVDIYMVDESHSAQLMTYHGTQSNFQIPLSLGSHTLRFYAVSGTGYLSPKYTYNDYGIHDLKQGQSVDYFQPSDNFADLWQGELEISVDDNSEDSIYSIDMKRACASVELFIDNAPTEARTVAIVMDCYKYINVGNETGMAKENIRRQMAFIPRPQDSYDPNANMKLIVPKEYVTHVNMFFINKDGGVITQRTIDNVRIVPNQRTLIKGSLADDNQMNFTFETEWIKSEVNF